MFSQCAPEMLPKIYKTLWLLLHTLFRVFAYVRHTWVHTVREVARNFEPTTIVDRDRQLIAKCCGDLSKVPRHVAVILNECGGADADRVEATALGRLMRWSQYTGIQHISFYDYRGRIEHVRPELYAQVRAYQQETAVNLGANGAAFVNGTSAASQQLQYLPNQQNNYYIPVAVHLVDPAHNRAHLVDVSRTLCRTVDAKDITISAVNAAVQRQPYALPEPELAFYFEEHCCTYGLSPWQIRLTEFVRLERNAAEVQLGSYLRALYKYAKCEQRFGK